MIQTIKLIHKFDIVFIRVGTFYQVYGKDSYIISYLFDYKIKFVEKISTCGFPKNSINRIMAKLEELKINYIIVDKKNNYDVDLFYDNKNLNTYEKYYSQAKIYVNLKIRVNNIYDFLTKKIDEKDTNVKEIIKDIENLIDERRKI